jgi:hypothetical protein
MNAGACVNSRCPTSVHERITVGADMYTYIQGSVQVLDRWIGIWVVLIITL